MNRVLDVGYTLNLSGKEFIIKYIVGKGASSVTYLAEHGKTEHILKECNPLGISMHRNEIGELVADSDLSRQKFEECLERFKAGADKQLSFRLTEDLKNPTSNIQDIYYANRTAYIDMTYFGGKTYDKLDSETLYDLFRRMKALAQIIGHYHKLGYLHLDIKPQNIYTIPETPEMVMMFDFDSVTPINDINAIISSSYTDVWAAPEQKLPKYRNQICEATDLFAIGEIIFFRLFGKHSEENDRYSFSQYEGFKDNKWFENVNPRVLSMITELLHKTLSCSAKKRYQNAVELVEQIDKIMKIISSTVPYLVSNIKLDYMHTKSLTKKLINIHEKLQRDGRYFNKSTPKRNISKYAAEYIEQFANCYEVVISLDCNKGFIDMFLDTSIKKFEIDAEKTSYEQVLQLFNALEHICNNHVLVVLNNFDERYLVASEFASHDYEYNLYEVHDICSRLLLLNATILVNGSFNIENFYKNEHYNNFHKLLYHLAEMCYHKHYYELAKDYIKKAISVIQYCSPGYRGDNSSKTIELLNMIRADEWWLAGYGDDSDELEIDLYLKQFEDYVDDI